ncbi:hypothetical protein ASPCAL12861 [Aspergillus calidoustus]|uniref:Uncharacterized protein n=1 Tax=Aspergillus calidoustus TaxID=454130 RepID=A0A0U5GBP1_ASPCI|nr:hypothetical protein ASPCAL12861 [Aspergillus calidoustus]
MMFSFHAIVLLGFWCRALFAYAHPLDRRQAPAIENAFNLYAYGDSISGLSVYYADGKGVPQLLPTNSEKRTGKAEVGDWTRSTAKVAYPVYFTTSSSSSETWIAHANTTGLGDASYADTVLSLPSLDSFDGTVQFKPKASSASSANVFAVYGNYVLIEAEDANFYAVPTRTEGVYSLTWSAVGSDQIAVILRTIAPATDTLL